MTAPRLERKLVPRMVCQGGYLALTCVTVTAVAGRGAAAERPPIGWFLHADTNEADATAPTQCDPPTNAGYSVEVGLAAGVRGMEIIAAHSGSRRCSYPLFFV